MPHTLRWSCTCGRGVQSNLLRHHRLFMLYSVRRTKVAQSMELNNWTTHINKHTQKNRMRHCASPYFPIQLNSVCNVLKMDMVGTHKQAHIHTHTHMHISLHQFLERSNTNRMIPIIKTYLERSYYLFFVHRNHVSLGGRPDGGGTHVSALLILQCSPIRPAETFSLTFWHWSDSIHTWIPGWTAMEQVSLLDFIEEIINKLGKEWAPNHSIIHSWIKAILTVKYIYSHACLQPVLGWYKYQLVKFYR